MSNDTYDGSVDLLHLRDALDFVRPMIRGHAGEIEIVEVRHGIVWLRFTGACETCPSLPMTFAGLVRSHLRRVPGVREVRSADVHASPRALDRIAVALGAQTGD